MLDKKQEIGLDFTLNSLEAWDVVFLEYVGFLVSPPPLFTRLGLKGFPLVAFDYRGWGLLALKFLNA